MNRFLIQKFSKIYMNSIMLDSIIHKSYGNTSEEDFNEVRERIEEISALTEEIYTELKSRDLMFKDEMFKQLKNLSKKNQDEK